MPIHSNTRPGPERRRRNGRQVDEDAASKSERLQRLQALITRQQHAAQKAMVGRTVNVLFEKPGRLAGQMVGKSDYLHAVHVTDPSIESGDIRPIRIVEAGANSLSGEVLRHAAE